MEKIIEQMKAYLQSKKYQIRTIEGYVRVSRLFMKWVEKEGLTLGGLTYPQGMKWVGWRQGKGVSSRTINQEILAINHLYQSQEKVSPLAELRLRGVRHQAVYYQIEYTDLENLYRQFNESGLPGKRNKVILGMVIYQGLSRMELENIRMEDLDMENALIRVRETAKINSRIMTLEAVQILDLVNYIYEVRPQLAIKETEYLFLSKYNGGKLANTISYLWKVLHKHYRVKLTTRVIRQSLINHWLKSKDLRMVQYLAGHKYVSSTFRYGQRSLEELQEELEIIHPLSKL